MRPRWVTSVGVSGIILGSLGILGAIQTHYLPQIIVAQSRMLSQSIDRGARSPVTDAMQQLMTSLVDSVTVNAPAWFGTWLACLSVAMVLVFSIYVYASVSLLKMEPHAVRWFVGATIAVCALKIVQAIVGALVLPILRLVAIPLIVFSLMIDIVLLAVVLAKSSRSAMQYPPPLPGGRMGGSQ